MPKRFTTTQSLQIDKASLNEADRKTKIVISCLARMAKESNRFDVFQHLRQIAPAGATGESDIHPNYILGLADEKRLYHERASIICQRSPSLNTILFFSGKVRIILKKFT